MSAASLTWYASALLLLVLTGCANRNCRCPCPSQPINAAAPAVPSPDPRYDAARKAWLDEIMASEKWAADCMFAADHESDAKTREQKQAECVEKYKARARANDEAFERAKATLGR